MAITLRQLRYFEQTANAGSVTEAARLLHVSQSAVSLAIKEMEAYFQTRLFERHNTGVGLTETGRLVFNEARKVGQIIDDLDALIYGKTDPMAGKVRMGISMAGLGFMVPGFLSDFRRNFPNVELQIFNYEWPDILTPLKEGALDFGITVLGDAADPMIKTQAFKIFPRRLLIHGDNDLSFQELIEPKTISDQNILLFEQDLLFDDFRHYLAEYGIDRGNTKIIKSTEAMRHLVAANMGIALLSELSYFAAQQQQNNIYCKRLLPAPPPIIIGAVTLAQAPLSEAAIILQDYLYDRCLQTRFEGQ